MTRRTGAARDRGLRRACHEGLRVAGRSLQLARDQDWTIVDMKDSWRTVFAPAPEAASVRRPT
ncbi:MAG TPA: hypothetical protein VHJ77_19865 [Vicinamibacterales bacterium]|nr:hypothetical protein [Vicinamibacterales bacterium]